MLNQVAIVGELIRDVELRQTSEGAAVTSLTLAVPRAIDVFNGNSKKDYIRCVLWNKSAENAKRYCKKGTTVGVVGMLSSRTYTNERKQKVYMTEVVADRVQFLGQDYSKDNTANVGIEEVDGNMNQIDLAVMESVFEYRTD